MTPPHYWRSNESFAPDDEQERQGRTSYVYRLYDERGMLLYVGCTYYLNRRVTWHRTNQPWGDRIAHVEHETFTDRFDAMDRERQLIWRSPPHTPRYNYYNNDVGILARRREEQNASS